MLRIHAIVKIDNTFNGFTIERLKVPQDKWKTDYGKGTDIKWYNQRSCAKKEKQNVSKIVVTVKVRERIQRKIETWINEL